MHKLYEILTNTPWIDTCSASNLSTNRQEITGDTGILFITLNYSLTQTAIRSTELITNHLSILRKKIQIPKKEKFFHFSFCMALGTETSLGGQAKLYGSRYYFQLGASSRFCIHRGLGTEKLGSTFFGLFLLFLIELGTGEKRDLYMSKRESLNGLLFVKHG